MIATLAVWLVALPAAAGYGRLLIPKAVSPNSVESQATRLYAGLLILSAFLLIIAFFSSLTPWWGLVVAAPGLAISIGSDGPNLSRVRQYVIYAPIALLVSIRETNLYDTALYHQQAVKWLSEYGVVRGLALVYFRLGWISSWFAFAAPLNHGFLAGRAAPIIGGLPLAFVVVLSLRVFRQWASECATNMASVALAFLGVMLTTVAVVWHVDTSLSPDLIIWLLPGILVTLLANAAVPKVDRVGRATVVSALACLVKLTSAPALVYCSCLLVWRFTRRPTERRKLAVYATAATAATALFLCGSVIISGCPFFPSPLGCTSTAWSVGSSAANTIQTELQDFARASRHNQIVPLTVAATLASAICLTQIRTIYVRHCLCICWIGIALTLVVAPVPRYGLGYFLLPIAVASGIVLDWFALRRSGIRLGLSSVIGLVPQQQASLSVAVAAFLAIPIYLYGRAGKTEALFYPPRLAALSGDPIHVVNRVVDLRGVLGLRSEQYAGLTVWVPTSSDQCWDAPLPCTPALTQASVSPRRVGNLDGGFVSATK